MQGRALIEGRDAALRSDAGQSSRARRREPLLDGAQLGDQEALTGVSADLQEALCAEGLTEGAFRWRFPKVGDDKRRNRFPEDEGGKRMVFPGRKPPSQVRGKREWAARRRAKEAPPARCTSRMRPLG